MTKHLYEIVPHKFVAHADDGDSITLQQKNPLGLESDARIYMNRDNAAKLRDALTQWLAETEARTAA